MGNHGMSEDEEIEYSMAVKLEIDDNPPRVNTDVPEISEVNVQEENALPAETPENVTENSRMKKCGFIEVRMIPAKVIYFFWGGLLIRDVFIIPFFKSVGLSTFEAGLITGISIGCATIIGPICGLIADYTRRYRSLLVVLGLGAAFSTFSIPWVAGVINLSPSNKTLQTTIANASAMTMERNKPSDNHTLFYAMLTLIGFSSMFIESLISFTENIAIKFIKTSKQNATYGGQRVFGNFGIFALTYLGGFAADIFNLEWVSEYTPVFCVVLICTFVVLILGWVILGFVDGVERIEDGTSENEANGRNISEKLKKLFLNCDTIFLMITVIISGLAYHVFLFFSILLATDEMDASQADMSLVPAIAAISSMLVFPFATMICERIGGVHVAVISGMFSYLIRFLGMSFCQEIWIMIVLQVLDGVGFALAWSAVVGHMNKVAVREIKTTALMITANFQFGLGSFMANLVGGEIYTLVGGRIFFRSIGILCGAWGCIMIVYCKFFKNTANI